MFRSFAWRLGRSLYRWARREGANNARTNGEYWLLDLVVSRADETPLVLMDIGANKGEWSATAAQILDRYRKRGRIHAFEPATATFEHLSRRFMDAESVSTHHLALSDRSGTSVFYVIGPLSRRNSLHPAENASGESVRTQSLDAFITEYGISRVTVVKSDTEGHDFTVIEGGQESLRRGRIDVWQFEYNHRWLANKGSLMAVFELIENLPYSLGRLYGDGIELYEQWHPELDRFIETNYVLIRHGSVAEGVARTMQFDGRNVPRLAEPCDHTRSRSNGLQERSE